jgi:N-methylhydantoinase A
VNAAVMPVVSRYLDDIQGRLAARGIGAPFYIMQSNGGVMSAEAAKARPVYMVESGPAAGVIAAGALAQAMGEANVISFDMGGTTAKVGLVRGGQPTLSTEYEVGSQAHSPLGEGKGSGYPVRTPVIDLVEVGAGGGSLAWIDGGGSLRVGPQSAGAEPGPVCYGRGGERPALTDANLVLGRLNPDYFLGGELKLDAAAARAALERHIAGPLGMEPLRAAEGVVEIANAGMIGAMRLISVQRGYDPRDFVLVAFGGAGPLHANALAAELEIRTILVPPSPGVASAIGLLMTDIRHEFVATRRALLAESAPAEMSATFAGFEEAAQRSLSGEREQWQSVSLVRTCDLRYKGQSHELQVVIPPGPLRIAELERTRALFEEAHMRAYGYVAADDPIELVNLRLTAVGKLPPLPRKTVERGSGDPAGALKGRRPLWLREAGETREAPVYDRYTLRAGDVLAGPAIVEEMDSSTVVLPGYTARTDEHGNLVITRDE